MMTLKLKAGLIGIGLILTLSSPLVLADGNQNGSTTSSNLKPIGSPDVGSDGLSPPSVVVAASTSGCSYNAKDTYSGTELAGSGFSEVYLGWGVGWAGAPTANPNLTLSWTGGATSPLATPVPCTGTYQVIFTLQVQSADSSSVANISPCVQTTDSATLVYGACPASAGGANTFAFNPQCNGGYFCTSQMFPFAIQVQLTAGQMVGPPSLYSDNNIAITGGEFMVYYYGP